MNNKVQLTQSEVHNIVLEATKQILLKEGIFQKIGNKIDGIEQKFDDKMDDLSRGYDLKEGNPQCVFDVIEGNGWQPILSVTGKDGVKRNITIKDGSNNLPIQRVRGAWNIHNGLDINELIEDINVFLEGRGHAAHLKTVNGNYEIININAPKNLITIA